MEQKDVNVEVVTASKVSRMHTKGAEGQDLEITSYFLHTLGLKDILEVRTLHMSRL